LNAAARRRIANRRNAVFFSAGSAWEIAIKAALGKLRLPEPAEDYVPSRVSSQGMGPWLGPRKPWASRRVGCAASVCFPAAS
jgi:PIN domain nuclease of toxin-antitoxin system